MRYLIRSDRSDGDLVVTMMTTMMVTMMTTITAKMTTARSENMVMGSHSSGRGTAGALPGHCRGTAGARQGHCGGTAGALPGEPRGRGAMVLAVGARVKDFTIDKFLGKGR